MKIVVAPDKFAGTMSAAAVAEALKRGWRSVRPDDRVECVPVADGGPGFVDCLRVALGGRLTTVPASGPLGDPETAQLLVARDGTCYVESAMANGLHLVPAPRRDPMRATTYGVGELVRAAVATGSRRVVVGLGGSATNDGGAGVLAALGAVAYDATGHEATPLLRQGPSALGGVAAIDLAGARNAIAGVELHIATDVDNPLLGPEGASTGFARQKGASESDVTVLEAALTGWARLCTEAGAPAALARAPGAGAAGGLGYGFLVAGGVRVAGIDTVLTAVDLARRCAGADVVVTGEGKFDWQSLHGKVVTGVVAAARAAGPAPVVVVCGRNEVSREQWPAAGIAEVASLVTEMGSVEAALTGGSVGLERIGARLARRWGHT